MRCAVCKNNLTFLFRLDTLRPVRRCVSCGLVQVSPLPSKQDIASFYHEDMPHFAPYLAQIDVHRKYFQQKVDDILKRITHHASRITLLDIGCALGVLLEEAQKIGWKATGIDISRDAVAYCQKKRLDVYHGTIVRVFQGSRLSLKREVIRPVVFDVITAFEIIEHERDPMGFARSIFKLVKPGGMAVITTPNHDGWGRRLMGKWWFGYQHPEHLFFFDPDSIIYLFRKAGFSVVEVRNDSPRPFPLSFAFTRAADYFPLLKIPLKAIGNLLDHWKLINPLNPWNDMIVVAQNKNVYNYDRGRDCNCTRCICYTGSMTRKWKHWKYKNLTMVGVGVVVAILLTNIPGFHKLLASFGSLGYFGAVLGGLLFVSTFTVATGAVILIDFANYLNPWEVALFAGFGAVVGDMLIFHVVRDDLVFEVKPIYKALGGSHLNKILHTRHFRWTLPVIGALIIASPLPDELGVSLMGISELSLPKFLLLSFFLNSLGIFLVVSAVTLVF